VVRKIILSGLANQLWNFLAGFMNGGYYLGPGETTVIASLTPIHIVFGRVMIQSYATILQAHRYE